MEDAVGLVHLPRHREPEHHPLRTSLQDFDVEELVNIVPPAREEAAVVGVGWGRGGHKSRVTGRIVRLA
jgi:hypothetical protein